jgi:hypothetical protein
VRDAANTLVTTLVFDADHRERHLKHASAILARTQRRKEQARRSHYKKRRRRLHALGLFTSRMRSCIPRRVKGALSN